MFGHVEPAVVADADHPGVEKDVVEAAHAHPVVDGVGTVGRPPADVRRFEAHRGPLKYAVIAADGAPMLVGQQDSSAEAGVAATRRIVDETSSYEVGLGCIEIETDGRSDRVLKRWRPVLLEEIAGDEDR